MRTTVKVFAGIIAGAIVPDSAIPSDNLPVRPNILYILTDQQQADMMSCTGNMIVRTPNLDKLAEAGIRFEMAYATNPVCSPSRFSMFTGLMPSEVGAEDNSLMNTAVPDRQLKNSMGSIFRKAGYKTAYGGKVHLPGTESGQRDDIALYGFSNITNDEREGLARTAAEFIRAEHNEPFLLVTSFINPHDICYKVVNQWRQSVNLDPIKNTAWDKLVEALKMPPGISEEQFFAEICPPLPDNFEIPENEIADAAGSIKVHAQYARDNWGEKEWRLHRWAYKNLTELVDGKIGVVLDALRESGKEENTLVIFTSDHGDMAGAHRLEHKAVFYEESVRVPLIIKWKGVITPGIVDRKTLVMNGLDIMPTMCDFAGIEIPGNNRGVSLKGASLEAEGASSRDFIVSETLNARMVFDGEWKYMISGNDDLEEMIFNLKTDPWEMHNLAPYPEYDVQLKRMRDMLVKWYSDNEIELAVQYQKSGAVAFHE